MRRSKRGVTLIELMAVTVILAILFAIVFAVVPSAKRRAMEAPCVSNMRQLFVAFTMYCDDEGGIRFPPPNLVRLGSYVSDKRVFRCPADYYVKEQVDGFPAFLGILWNDPNQVWSDWQISYSYVRDYSPAANDEYWPTIAAKANVGLFACGWHGTVSKSLGGYYATTASPLMEGPILRICFDGHLFRWPKRKDPYVWSNLDMFYYPWVPIPGDVR